MKHLRVESRRWRAAGQACLLAATTMSLVAAAGNGNGVYIVASSNLPPAGAKGTSAVPASAVSKTAEEHVVYLIPGRPVAAVTSTALSLKAWKALEGKQYGEVFTIADECVKRFSERAKKQQAQLKDFAGKDRAASYAALNDVATCLFIKGKALRELRRFDEAKNAFQQIPRDYRFAQCWDPKGWYWKVAWGAQDEINCIDYGVDFGDYTSAMLTERAWKAYQAGHYEATELYVRKCVELYADTARKMQSTLGEYPPKGSEHDYWALNDVATCLFIRGKALRRQRRNKDAALVFRDIVEHYPSALCWDPNGWFWKIAEEARRNLAGLS
ncbi:MAG: tetratricopeptide repeat protein [Verrucomicrobiota bacterium]